MSKRTAFVLGLALIAGLAYLIGFVEGRSGSSDAHAQDAQARATQPLEERDVYFPNTG